MNMNMNARTMTALSAAIVVGLVILIALLIWALWPDDSRADFEVLAGYTTIVNQDGTVMGFAEDRGGEGEEYDISGAHWKAEEGPWMDTMPTCVMPLSSGQPVRLGIAHLEQPGDMSDMSVVVWVECTGEPTTQLDG